MKTIYKLINSIKHYEWGSARWIPQLLDIENNNPAAPYAEMWMGTHAGSPSRTKIDDKPVNLTEVSGDIPFLLKLLGVEKPLSIQAHPDKAHAQEGCAREESLGIAMDDPARNYKDPNHKPEIICALSPFTLMAGFREPHIIRRSFEELLTEAPQLKGIISQLLLSLETDSLSSFFAVLFKFSEEDKVYLSGFINKKDTEKTGGVISSRQWELMKKFTELYPLETAVLAPLYLNVITLQPYQAVYVPDGMLHAYISGFGLELMTSSDNVLRGGLTNKHIDIDELFKILKFIPFMPDIILHDASDFFNYPAPCREFFLANIRGSGSREIIKGNGSAVCIVTEGELETEGIKIKKGESFYIPKDTEKLMLKGNYSLFAASGSIFAEKNI